MSHEIGHLPFEADISNLLTYGAENRVTVVCDNTLLQDTIPQGGFVELTRYVTNTLKLIYLKITYFEQSLLIYFQK